MDVLDPAPAAAAVALVIAIAAGVGVLWMWLSTKPQRLTASGATTDLRTETPALVDLVTGGFDVDDDAVPATAVDLATRGYFDFEDYGGEVIIRQRTRSSSSDVLTPYEERILHHVRAKSHDGVTPAAVVTIGPDGVSERWFKSFTREVTRDAREHGLCRRRFGLKHLGLAWALVIVGLVPTWIVGRAAGRTDDPTAWGSIGNLMLGLSLLCGIGVVALTVKLTTTDSQADTPDGRAAGAHWLGVRDAYRAADSFERAPAASVAIWERHLAYATAMGLAPLVQRQLPFETEHDRQAWSRATGRWRRVRVRYQSFRPGWGQHPGKVALSGLVQAVVYGAIAYFALTAARSTTDLESLDDQQRQWVSLAAALVALLASVATVFALVKFVVGVADLFPRRVLEGEVVRSRTYRSGHRLPKALQWAMWSGQDEHGQQRGQHRRTRHHIAIDDGTDDRILTYQIRPAMVSSAPQGARVRAKVSPLLGYVSSLELLTAPPRPDGGDPVVPHALVEDTVSTASSALGAGLAAAMQRADGLTGPDGRPLMEQTDDDGVTLGERLGEARSQLDKLRADPRIATSPLAGLLDAFGRKDTVGE